MSSGQVRWLRGTGGLKNIGKGGYFSRNFHRLSLCTPSPYPFKPPPCAPCPLSLFLSLFPVLHSLALVSKPSASSCSLVANNKLTPLLIPTLKASDRCSHIATLYTSPNTVMHFVHMSHVFKRPSCLTFSPLPFPPLCLAYLLASLLWALPRPLTPRVGVLVECGTGDVSFVMNGESPMPAGNVFSLLDMEDIHDLLPAVSFSGGPCKVSLQPNNHRLSSSPHSHEFNGLLWFHCFIRLCVRSFVHSFA